MQQTENYDLNLMDLSDPLRMESREGLNENFTIIDEALKEASENGGIAVQDTQPTTGVLAWIDSDAQGADFCMVGDTEPPTDGTVALWVDTSEDERPIDLVDYIVEQGTSGIWTYRKWKSGVAECWGKTTVSSTTWTVWASPIYYSTTYSDRINYPTNLFVEAPIVTPSIYGTSDGWIGVDCTNLGTATQTGKYYALRINSGSTTASYTVSFYVIGRWK